MFSMAAPDIKFATPSYPYGAIPLPYRHTDGKGAGQAAPAAARLRQWLSVGPARAYPTSAEIIRELNLPHERNYSLWVICVKGYMALRSRTAKVAAIDVLTVLRPRDPLVNRHGIHRPVVRRGGLPSRS